MSAATQTVIVVPCYNEAERLDVAAFEEYLSQHASTDFLFVNDGSIDGTGPLLDGIERRWPGRARALHLEQNSGKAEAVRRGMLLALEREKAKYAGFWDADLATPLNSIPVFVDVLDRMDDLDIVLGARAQLLGRRIDRKLSRHYLGRVFATFASLVLALPVYDTQCGAKLFRVGDRCRALFAQPFGSRWIFDVEFLARYVETNGRKSGIYELPLDEWRDIGDSKVKPTDFVRAIGEMAQIYRRYRVSVRFRKLFDLLTAPFLRYSGAGAIGTLVHYVLLTVSVELASLEPDIGAVVGATGGAFVNYWFNYHFTFVSTRSHRETLPRFLTVAALGVALNWYIVRFMTESLGVHYLVGQVAATLAVLLVGFVLNRTWTFGRDAAN